MENYEEQKKLRKELAGYKTTLRKAELDRETARYLATEILALERLLR